MDLVDTAFVCDVEKIFFSPVRAVGVTAPPCLERTQQHFNLTQRELKFDPMCVAAEAAEKQSRFFWSVPGTRPRSGSLAQKTMAIPQVQISRRCRQSLWGFSRPRHLAE